MTLTSLRSLITKLTTTNLGRSIAHALLAFAFTVGPQLVWTSASTLKASLIAAIPAAAVVLFRALFPNVPPLKMSSLADALSTLQNLQPSPTPVTPTSPSVAAALTPTAVTPTASTATPAATPTP